MNFEVPVNDSTHTKTSVIKSISIMPVNLILGQSVDLHVMLMDDQKRTVDTAYFKIFDSEYDGWGNDDNYITNLVLQKLQLTKKI